MHFITVIKIFNTYRANAITGIHIFPIHINT